MNEKEKFTYNTQEKQYPNELRKRLNEALDSFVKHKHEFENKETGLKAIIKQDDVDKISSKEAYQKSENNNYTKEEHFKVAEDIGNLYENATLKKTHADFKQRPNVANVHRFNINIEVNEKDTITKITVLERIEGQNRIYAMELQTNPPRENFSVLEAEVAKSLNFELSAHTNNPTIANFDDKSIAQSKQQSQGKVDKKKSKSKSNDYGMGM